MWLSTTETKTLRFLTSLFYFRLTRMVYYRRYWESLKGDYADQGGTRSPAARLAPASELGVILH